MFFWNSLAFSMIQRMLVIWLQFSAFSKSSLNIWKCTIHKLLKPGLENFEHYFANMWNECNCVVVWTFLVLPFFGIRMKPDLFQSFGHCWVFQICWHTECSTFTASSFSIWNSSTGIPSLPLALFVVMLPKTHLTLHSKMSGPRWVISPSWLFGSLKFFLYSSSVYSCHLFLDLLLGSSQPGDQTHVSWVSNIDRQKLIWRCNIYKYMLHI